MICSSIDWNETKACKADVYLWPKEIDGDVAKLHLRSLSLPMQIVSMCCRWQRAAVRCERPHTLGAELTVLTQGPSPGAG